MIDDLLSETRKKMQATIAATKQEFVSIRTGRANPALLDRVEVDYYGTATPLQQLASISVPEPRSLLVQPWDKSALADIEKAIMQADLGLTPNNDGDVIRIQLPQLTEERRKELVRFVRKVAENHRVSIRNARRDANEDIKVLEKDGDISEDEARRAQEQAQAMTDEFIAEIDQLLQQKETEIMEV